MTKRDRDRLLKEFKKNKYGRSLEEAERLLREFGFIRRVASKEASVWKRGRISLTLPNPKMPSLLVDYVVLIVRKINEAEETGIPEEPLS